MELREQLESSLRATYSIERELPSGGMSRVFVATEAALGRAVVIKVLPPELGAEVNVERFRREIQTTAQIVHPHIVPVLSAGEASGVPYYTMPYIEGESLRSRLVRDGRVPVDEAIRLAIELAEALDYAHRHGIVHRDIKPENVLLHDGHAMVADFGIARAVRNATSTTTLTQAGIVIGTPTYMSPEQAVGDRDVDSRTDIYSLGCVLYEILAGKPPYSAGTPQGLIVLHVTEAIPDVAAARPDVPAHVAHAIAKALAKAPEDRFASVAEFARALKDASLRATPAPHVQQSIAVLPFDNLSGSSESDYLCDGFTEEVLTALAALKDVRVAARTSSFAFKGRTGDVREVSKQLGVQHVLSGSIRVAGQKLRVTAQLVDGATGFQQWSEKYDREFRDVLGLQDEIAGIIARKLETTLVDPARSHRATANLEAYDSYLRGMFAWNRGTAESWDSAARFLEESIRLDPSFAQAWITLAEVLIHKTALFPSDAASARLKEAVSAALQLDPALADAHAMRAHLKCFSEWEWGQSETGFLQAIGLNPNSLRAHQWFSVCLSNLGEGQRSVDEAERAIALDPLAPAAHQTLQLAFLLAGRHDEAIAEGARTIALEPSYYFSHIALGASYLDAKRPMDALSAFTRAGQLAPGSDFALCGSILTQMALGDRDRATRLFLQLDQQPMRYRPCTTAWAHAAFGRIDAAFDCIEQGIGYQDRWIVSIPSFSWWDPLRSDPRFLATMRRLKFPSRSYGRMQG